MPCAMPCTYFHYQPISSTRPQESNSPAPPCPPTTLTILDHSILPLPSTPFLYPIALLAISEPSPRTQQPPPSTLSLRPLPLSRIFPRNTHSPFPTPWTSPPPHHRQTRHNTHTLRFPPFPTAFPNPIPRAPPPPPFLVRNKTEQGREREGERKGERKERTEREKGKEEKEEESC